MFKNYIKIAWRNLTKNKSYTVINIFGLAVGMACCLLIGLYIQEELSFDTFHENVSRIAAVGNESGFFGTSLITPYPLADALVEEIPLVENAVRMNSTGRLLLSKEGENFIEIEKGNYTSSAFFEMFSFNLLSGNEDDALSTPNRIVLSEHASQQLFGAENPIGQSLYWQKRDTLVTLQVSGIIENQPRNSSIEYGALVSANTMEEGRRSPGSWNASSFSTFALLKNPQAFSSMDDQLQSLVERHYEPSEEGEYSRQFFALPLTKFHLSEITDDPGFTGNRAYIYLFGSIALFILIIACVNYVNLATARATLRAKEVGVRKVLGAMKKQVAGQFIGESIILSTMAYIIGCGMTILALPFFNQLFGTSLEWKGSTGFMLWLILAAVGIGIIAGLYPSFYLSRFSPSSVLRSQKTGTGSGSFLRKTLVVAQFSIALVLIIGSLVVYKQLQFTQTKDLGFNGEQVVVVDLPNYDAWSHRNVIRNNLVGLAGIQEISMAGGSPGKFNVRFSQPASALSIEIQIQDKEREVVFAPASVDYNFLELLDIKILTGRVFSENRGSDVDEAIILNVQMAEMLGWTPEQAIGKPFEVGGKQREVIGVVENFHISSLHKEIEGVTLTLHDPSSTYGGGSILAKLAPDRISQVMDVIEDEVKSFAPNTPFTYEFLDDRFDAMYRTEQRFGKIVALFTCIAIVIACLGLYGLATFSAERRIKEIGIRKVLGASVTNIVSLLSKDFLKLVVLGFLISVPIAWYAMNQWLTDFAYRIEIGVGFFVTAGVAAILIAILTVSWQSVKAAVANPVDSLRSE